jgi:TPR repeat protein
MKQLFLVALIFFQSACGHVGLDSPADISAENCYAYRYGDKLRRQNFVKAFDWCQRSAQNGNANNQVLLAELYYLGLGGEIDITHAEQWYLKAAKQGHAHGQFMLYKIYSFGINDKLRDKAEYQALIKQAEYWLRQAKGSGYHFAMEIKD